MKEKPMKLRVRYQATFETTIEVDEHGFQRNYPAADLIQEYSDDISDINIPENRNNEYQPDTFEVIDVDPVLNEDQRQQLGGYCFSCGGRYSQECLDGGRCLNWAEDGMPCGTMICAGTQDKIEQQFAEIANAEIKNQILDSIIYCRN